MPSRLPMRLTPHCGDSTCINCSTLTCLPRFLPFHQPKHLCSNPKSSTYNRLSNHFQIPYSKSKWIHQPHHPKHLATWNKATKKSANIPPQPKPPWNQPTTTTTTTAAATAATAATATVTTTKLSTHHNPFHHPKPAGTSLFPLIFFMTSRMAMVA